MSGVRDPAELAAAVDLAATHLDGLARRDVPLGPLTTYRVGGAAALFVEVGNRTDLLAVGEAARMSELPVLVIGRGSNMLVADAGFPGIVASLRDLDAVISIDRHAARVTASAGVALPVLARKTAAAGLTGFEWAVGVPGSVGGAVRMNAGGHGSDMASSLVAAVVVDLDAGVERVVPVDDLGLGFRSSGLGETEIVVEATLQLAPGDAPTSSQLIGEIVSWRRANQPGGQNAGSVFVNPVPGEVSAGALIDAAGLRGYRLGSAVVSDKHANFIQADDGGSADDVFALMTFVRQRVEAASGLRLRSEIRLVGFEAGEAAWADERGAD